MAIDIANLYRTGYPSLGTLLRFNDGTRAMVIRVFIRKQDVDRQRTPRVLVTSLDRNGKPSQSGDHDLVDYTNWFNPRTKQAQVEKEGPYEVVSPVVTP